MTKMETKESIQQEQELVKPVRMAISVNEIPRYFERDTLCSTDIIAYVRKKDRCPDPRIPVILEADCTPFDKETLSGNKIFWAGPGGNEDEVSLFSGLSSNVCLPIYTDEFDVSKEDYGVVSLGASFGTLYNIKEYMVLLCGECTDAVDDPLTNAWEYVQYSYNGPIKFDTTYAVADKQRKLTDGVDIADVVKSLSSLKAVNELNHVNLMRALNQVGDRIKDMQMRGLRPRIQCLLPGHPQDVQLLLLYLPLKYNLSPLYVEPYLRSYVDYKFNYDYEKLSLYERFMWARNLPEEFGYLGPNVSFFCFCALSDDGLFLTAKKDDEEDAYMSEKFGRRMSKYSAKRIYPKPLYVAYVNMSTSDRSVEVFRPEDLIKECDAASEAEERGDENAPVVSDLHKRLYPHMRLFNFLNYGDVIPMVDFRNSFTGSKEYFTDEMPVMREDKKVAKMGNKAAADKKVDIEWRTAFVSVAEYVREKYDDQIYPTVKNTLLYGLSNTEFLMLYCPGSMGLTCRFTSEFFDKDLQIVGEEDFHRFIDMRTLLALIEKTPLQSEKSFQDGNKRFAEIMTLQYRNLSPASDYDVMLAVNMLLPRNNGLSYYDKMLRSTVNIMPIVTDEDNPMYRPSELLKHFTYLNLLSADESTMPLTTVTCFGTLEDDVNDKPVLQTTIESYRGCELL